MWIDTDQGSHFTATPPQRNAFQKEFPLFEFPYNLVLQGKTFSLRAVIAFQGDLTQDALEQCVTLQEVCMCLGDVQ